MSVGVGIAVGVSVAVGVAVRVLAEVDAGSGVVVETDSRPEVQALIVKSRIMKNAPCLFISFPGQLQPPNG